MTAQQRQALRILSEHMSITASQFAAKMWPDSKGWDRISTSARGTTRGTGMALRAGPFLADLQELGWVRFTWVGAQKMWMLTDRGERMVKASERRERR